MLNDARLRPLRAKLFLTKLAKRMAGSSKRLWIDELGVHLKESVEEAVEEIQLDAGNVLMLDY